MPSSDCQTALDLYKSSVELEVELRQATKSRSIFDKQVATLRSKLRDTYEKIIFLDYEFAQSKEVEQNLWKNVYYKVIEDFRKKIRALPAPNGRSKSTSNKKLISSFRSFLHEATGFYYSFIQKFAIHFELKQLDSVIKNFGLTIEPAEICQRSYSEDIKQRAVLSCHKSLIFLGDLARYRELQSDRVNKNWSTACDYYNHARQLVPDSGNPHNQLAVIATYNSDDFLAVYHYYRSLVVKHQFLTAKDNISLLFHKAQSDTAPDGEADIAQKVQREYSGKRRFSHQRQASSSSANKLKANEAIQSFFADFIRLQSILYLKLNLETYSELKASVLNQLKEHVLSRALEPDHLLKLTVINMAALYVIRLISNGENGSTNHSPKATSTYSQSSKKALVEKHSVLFVLDTLTTLLDMCNSELADVSIDGKDQKHNAVQILPASVKRSLASLRVGTKWVYSRLDYIASMSNIISKDPNVNGEFVNFARFWECYAEFLNAMERLFPHDQGVPLDVPLKEDFELNGFLVLKDHIFVDKNVTANQGEPFEELDMRIHDIFEDAKKISESKLTQLFYYDGVFSASEPPVNNLSPAEHEIVEQHSLEDTRDEPKAVTDFIDQDDGSLAESQSFSPNSPNGKNNDDTVEDESEDEVILFTGRHSTIIDNDNLSSTTSKKSSPRPIEKPVSPTTAEFLLSQVLNQPVTSSILSSSVNKTEQQKYWNHFNTPQLFPTNNNPMQYDKLETKSIISDKPDYLTPVSRPPTTISNGLLNMSHSHNQTSIASPTPVSGVPNASQDPLVPSTKRSLNDVKTALPYQNPATSPSPSASLFAFPGSEVSQFGLFGHSNNGYTDTTSAKVGTSATVAPPPGFASDSSSFEIHKQGQQQNSNYQQSLFQTSNAFAFPSFDIMRTQWNNGSNYKINGTSDNNTAMQINGTVYQGNRDMNTSDQTPDSLFWFTNSTDTNITSSKKGANVSLPDQKATNDSRDQFRYYSSGWTHASIG
ncbi:protein SMG7 [Rhizophagus clarus]|nr:protein SMG7 [Rhizophagus clarus]